MLSPNVLQPEHCWSRPAVARRSQAAALLGGQKETLTPTFGDVHDARDQPNLVEPSK
jgi:hypothetical protein